MRKKSWLPFIFFIPLFILGFVVRINGISNTPLSVDEYYLVTSVQNILKYGLPHFDTGGYYVRGLLYQYI